MFRLLLIGVAIGGSASATAAAQDRAPPEVVAFTDTAAVRFEVRLTDLTLDGAPVHLTIVPVAGGPPLWTGPLGTLRRDGAAAVTLTARIDVAGAARWTPEAPVLYRAEVQIRGPAGSIARAVRIGFRRVEARDGRILLNGRPVFLRGNAINPPGRNLPDSLDRSPRFAVEYLRYLKGLGVNLVRFGSPSQVWFDAADEVGMLVLQGHYGVPRGGTVSRPPKDVAAVVRWYRDEVLAPQASHPSVIIYALSNELAAPEIPYLNVGHAEISAFLDTVYRAVRAWDDTRLVLGNAGYGFGRAGELCDLHRYWGWYYNSFLSYYTLRDPAICWREGRTQPITLSENTGNYTGVDGRFNLVSDTKQPDSQLNWTGHAPDAEQGPRALAYQAWLAGQAIEITRRLRSKNPALAGLSPFTILFANWDTPRTVEEMGPKPITRQFARSYQPVLLSWELWTPQVYAGATIHPVAHVVNDAASGQALDASVLRYALTDQAGRERVAGAMDLPAVPHYGTAARELSVTIPTGIPSGQYRLQGWLVSRGDTVSRNEVTVRVAAPVDAGSGGRITRRLALYDPDGRTARALTRLGVTAEPIADLGRLAPGDAVIIGTEAWDRVTASPDLERFVRAGGRALVLDQRPDRFDPAWLPGGVAPSSTALDHALIMPGGRPFAQGMAVNPEWPGHPVFDGLTRDDLFLWSDPTGWREDRPGLPAVYPVTRGFALTRPEDLGRAAVLANYDKGLEGVALAEFFVGQGTVLVSGFDLVSRAGLDPAADRLLRNLVRYAADTVAHLVRPEITAPIVWGDYETERGVLTGIHSGLLVHTVPRVPAALQSQFPVRLDERGFVHAGTPGGWNTRPAIQFVAAGRRPFGPFRFTNGGSYELPPDADAEGVGRVWVGLPPGRSVMTTTVENPTDAALHLAIDVGAGLTRHPVPPKGTATLTTPLAGTGPVVGITFRGDRRLVLRRTEFH